MEVLILDVVYPGESTLVMVGPGQLGELGGTQIRVKGLLEGDDVEVEFVGLVLMLGKVYVHLIKLDLYLIHLREDYVAGELP